MDFDIDERLKVLVRDCPKWQICLSGDLSFCGRVVGLEGETLLVEPSDVAQAECCTKFFEIGAEGRTSRVCICPVRKEIYRKYGK